MKVCTGKTVSYTLIYQNEQTPTCSSSLHFMREKKRNISWLSISSSAFLPNEMLDKRNFTTHAWCEHNVIVFGINEKKVTEKKVNKNVLVSCMSLLFSSCSQFLFSFQWNKCCSSKKSKDTLWLLAIVQQAGNVCRLQHRHLQCRVPPSPMLPPLQPQQEARMAMQNSLGTSAGCPRRH